MSRPQLVQPDGIRGRRRSKKGGIGAALGVCLLAGLAPFFAARPAPGAGGTAKAPKADPSGPGHRGDESEPPPPKVVGRGAAMDYGPFLSYSVTRPRPAAPAATRPAANPPAAPSGRGDRAAAKPSDDAGPRTAPKPSAQEAASLKVAAATKPAAPAGKKEDDLLAVKGITVRLGHDACAVFDTDLLRLSAGWAGGFLDVAKTNIGGLKGDFPASAVGALQFTTGRPGPGWGKGGNLTDPRPAAQGPLPRDWAHYKGLYRHGDRVVFAYTIGKADVLEMPGATPAGATPEGAGAGPVAFTRTIRVESSDVPMRLLICAAEAGPNGEEATGRAGAAGATRLSVPGPDGLMQAAVNDAPRGSALRVVEGGRVVLDLPALGGPAAFKVVIVRSPIQAPADLEALAKSAGGAEDLPALCRGGPGLWKDAVVTAGARADDDAAYVVDTIKLPEKNPWNAWVRPGGHDFFRDGRMAVCTLNGDVWVVAGLDAGLGAVAWKRYAAGLYEALGLRVMDDAVYVLGRDQITRLHDLNGDGEADFYENFNNDCVASPIYHAFAFDLQTDSRGNFYFVRDANQVPPSTPDHGCLFKVSRDGSRSEVVARGFRAPNGMGVGPHDEIVVGDNQGHWTPSSKINLVSPGGFYGYVGDPRRLSKAEMDTIDQAQLARYPALGYEPPLCWIPYGWDNSSGGQFWATNDKWGPLAGRLLHSSYGKSTLFEVLAETVEGRAQGGVVQLPLKFDSGVMRGRFSPLDGQLYVSGLKGWQTNAGKDGCLQRVRYTGKPFAFPVGLRVTGAGIYVTFDAPLDPASAGDGDSYGVEAFTYLRSSTYGSPEFKASDPKVKGHDVIAVKSAKVSEDRRSVFLELPEVKPEMQMTIKMQIRAADGSPIKCTIGNTIHRVPADRGFVAAGAGGP